MKRLLLFLLIFMIAAPFVLTSCKPQESEAMKMDAQAEAKPPVRIPHLFP